MIFHGVYTTPQQIDSTLSTTSNNAVNGQSVADYVNAKIISEITDESDATSITSPKAVADYVADKAGGGGGGITPEYRLGVLDRDGPWNLSSAMMILDKLIYITFDAVPISELSLPSFVGYIENGHPKPVYEVMALIFINDVPASVEINTSGFMYFRSLNTSITITNGQHVQGVISYMIAIDGATPAEG
jgi:hypothetical protein